MDIEVVFDIEQIEIKISKILYDTHSEFINKFIKELGQLREASDND